MMTIEHLINSVLRFLCVAFTIITKSVDKKIIHIYKKSIAIFSSSIQLSKFNLHKNDEKNVLFCRIFFHFYYYFFASEIKI